MGEESEKEEEMDVEEVSESTIGSARQSISPTIVNNTSNTAKEESSIRNPATGRPKFSKLSRKLSREEIQCTRCRNRKCPLNVGTFHEGNKRKGLYRLLTPGMY